VLGADVDAARDHDDAALAVSGVALLRLAGRDEQRLEADIVPARRLRRDRRAERDDEIAHKKVLCLRRAAS
jgi:hypothetical protein